MGKHLLVVHRNATLVWRAGDDAEAPGTVPVLDSTRQAGDDLQMPPNGENLIHDQPSQAGDGVEASIAGSRLVRACTSRAGEPVHQGGAAPCTLKSTDQVSAVRQQGSMDGSGLVRSSSGLDDDDATAPGSAPHSVCQQAAAVAAADRDFEELWLRAQKHGRPAARPLRRGTSMDQLDADPRLRRLQMQPPPGTRGAARWLPPGALQWLMAAVSNPLLLRPKMQLPPAGVRSAAAAAASSLLLPQAGPLATQGPIRLDLPLNKLAPLPQHALGQLLHLGLDTSQHGLVPDCYRLPPCTAPSLPPGCTSRPLHFPDSLAASPAPRCDLEHLLLAATPVIVTSKPTEQLLMVGATLWQAIGCLKG